MGDGFVEAIDSNTLVAIAIAQPPGQRGMVIQVPVMEAPGNNRVGRFGWKNQNCSLLSFSADAYVNEVGITSPLQPTENTSNGRSVAAFDTVADPEDTGARPPAPSPPSLACPPRSSPTCSASSTRCSPRSLLDYAAGPSGVTTVSRCEPTATNRALLDRRFAEVADAMSKRSRKIAEARRWTSSEIRV